MANCQNMNLLRLNLLLLKETILKYMVQKKQEYARKLKEYERQKTDDLKDLREIADAEKSEAVKEFEKKEKNLSAASKGEFF